MRSGPGTGSNSIPASLSFPRWAGTLLVVVRRVSGLGQRSFSAVPAPKAPFAKPQTENYTATTGQARRVIALLPEEVLKPDSAHSPQTKACPTQHARAPC